MFGLMTGVHVAVAISDARAYHLNVKHLQLRAYMFHLRGSEVVIATWFGVTVDRENFFCF